MGALEGKEEEFEGQNTDGASESSLKPKPSRGDISNSADNSKRTSKPTRILFGLLGLLALLIPLWSWQTLNQQTMLSSTSIRKTGNALLIYSQDWDYRLPPPTEILASGKWVSWPQRIRPYLTSEAVLSNPSNPVEPFASKAEHPTEPRTIDTSYALNRRFWNTFSSGPFPIENLELPGETVLLIEAGVMTAESSRPLLHFGIPQGEAFDTYGDTTDRVGTKIPYPAIHNGQTVVLALDGHSIAAKPAYTDKNSEAHDILYGRVVSGIFNWNGGHPNGETDRPVRE